MPVTNFTHRPVSGSQRSPTIDYSSLSVLADCQWRWRARYIWGIEGEPSTAMRLGTLLHECCREFYARRPWAPVIEREFSSWQEENPEADFIPEWIETAAWLMDRYEQHYAADREDVEQIGSEVPFKLRLPGRYGWLRGSIDELWRVDRRVWVVERKTSRDFRRFDSGLYNIDPQVSIYYWAARQMGYEPFGICLDVLRTYCWKRDEHPPEDSFRREFHDRNEAHLERAIAEATNGLQLAKLIAAGRLEPVRNISERCDWCDVRNECVTDLAFGDMAVPDGFVFDEEVRSSSVATSTGENA